MHLTVHHRARQQGLLAHLRHERARTLPGPFDADITHLFRSRRAPPAPPSSGRGILTIPT